MKADLRFNLQHAGDVFADAVHKTADSTVVITKKLLRAYDLNALHSKKKKLSDEIIGRVSAQINGGNGEVSHDTSLARLVTRLNEVEKELAGYKKQKAKYVGPVTSTLMKLGKALFSSKK